MTTATGNGVLQAFSRSTKRILEDPYLNSTATSAGFIIPRGQKRGERDGYQVFVKLIRYTDQKLKKNRNSGGLWARV